MRVLVIAPERKPRMREIPDTLEAMQQIVGGAIEVIYPYDGIALVSNRDGKGLSLPPNRELRDEDGIIYDIICGTFFLCGAPETGEDFISLTDAQLQRYSELFAVPRLFMNLDNRIVILPCGEQPPVVEEKEESEMRQLWLWLGVTIEITESEEQDIFSGDNSKMKEVLRTVIAQGRFYPDGDTYIPSEAVWKYNQSYRATHSEKNWGCDL